MSPGVRGSVGATPACGSDVSGRPRRCFVETKSGLTALPDWGVSTFEAVHEPLVARDVLLGRTTHVRRLVPNKTRRMIGAWCFLDHYGPDDVKAHRRHVGPAAPAHRAADGDLAVRGRSVCTPTASGSHQLIRPGQLNVMTAGAGICHAEVSPDDAPTLLHGVQLWVCLPDAVRDSTPPDFTHLADAADVRPSPAVADRGCSSARWPARRRRAPTYTPLVGAEITLEPGAEATRAARPGLRVRRPGGPGRAPRSTASRSSATR